MIQRKDNFIKSRQHLENYSDQELKAYFYKLIDQAIDPLLDLAYDHTTPAIERSVLMRMGFSSLEAKQITDLIFDHDLLSHGAGHVVYVYAKHKQLSIREAGLKLLESDEIKNMVEVFKHD